MDPLVTGSLIAGGANLLGGIMGGRSASASDDRSAAFAQAAATKGVQWRVRDAIAAGVHPLFALGFQGSFAPAPQTGKDFSYVGRAGEAVGNAVAATRTQEQRTAMLLQMDGLKASAANDYAQASYWDAQSAKTRADMSVTSPFPGVRVDPISGALTRPYSGFSSESRQALDVHTSRQRSGGQALQYGWQDFDFGDGPVTLFRGDPDNLMSDLQDMDNATRVAIIAENTKRGQLAALAKLMDVSGPGRRGRLHEQYGPRPKGEKSYGGYPYGGR